MMSILPTVLIASIATSVAAEPFTMVVLPDTQFYVDLDRPSSNFDGFLAQTNWIRDEVEGANERNIAFVTHVGDVVQRGRRLAEWIKADQAMDILNGVVPFSILPGNHDWNNTNDKSSGIAFYLTYMGPQRFQQEPWFLGSSPNGLNTAQLITVGDDEFLHIAIEWNPPSIATGPNFALAWAQSVIDAHPNTLTIVSTHEYLDDTPPRRDPIGDLIWEDFIRHNNQIFLVLGGHFCSSTLGTNAGERHQISTNNDGQPVLEVLQDFQCYPNGGDGWLRLIEIDRDAGTVAFETYSPLLDAFQNETISQVGQYASRFTVDLNLDERIFCSQNDLNNDGRLDGLDIAAFIPLLIAGGRDVDLNGDRDLDFFDLMEFIKAVEAGCP